MWIILHDEMLEAANPNFLDSDFDMNNATDGTFGPRSILGFAERRGLVLQGAFLTIVAM